MTTSDGFYFVAMLFVLGTFGLQIRNRNWANLGYFSHVVGGGAIEAHIKWSQNLTFSL